MSPPIPSPALLGHVGLWRLWAAVGLLGAVVVALVVAGAVIARKAGYSPLWALLLLVPLVNLAVVIVFAGSDWPVRRSARLPEARDGPESDRPVAPPPGQGDAGPGRPRRAGSPDAGRPQAPGSSTRSTTRSSVVGESAWRRPVAPREVGRPGRKVERDRANPGGPGAGGAGPDEADAGADTGEDRVGPAGSTRTWRRGDPG